MTCHTSPKIQNLNLVASLIFTGQSCILQYRRTNPTTYYIKWTNNVNNYDEHDSRRNYKGLQQVHIDSVEVEVTEDLFNIDGSRPNLVFKDPSSEFYGLTAIQYQGEIIFWLQREYGDHVQVEYTLYEDYLVAQNQRRHIYPKYIARLTNLLHLNRVIKCIVHDDAWYLPENPEFEYGCLINIRGSILYFTIPEDTYYIKWTNSIYNYDEHDS